MEGQTVPLEHVVALVVFAVLIGGFVVYRWLSASGGAVRAASAPRPAMLRTVAAPSPAAALDLAEAKRRTDTAVDKRLVDLDFEKATLQEVRGVAKSK
jgi:hypothetical protein